MKRLLMVAFHFPPLAGSSGIQRTLRLVQHLPQHGWQALVLTVTPRAYERTGVDPSNAVPPGTVVRRAFGLDTARHLSLRGKYLGALARPDRWVSWRIDGVRQGLQLCRELKPCAIWSTYPIATAHVIGAELSRRSGLPWIADFRDPMAQDGYPSDLRVWQSYQAIEQSAMDRAALCTFTSAGAAEVYGQRYPHARDRISVLENGYDEDAFARAESGLPVVAPLRPGAIVLLHSGIIYPAERDPQPLFLALARLRRLGLLEAGKFVLRFRAPVHEGLIHRLAAQAGVSDLIEVCGAIGYADALQEMLRADALLVLQGDSCNQQIPAKAYEYLRARRPVLCLADPAGDTAKVVRQAGVDTIARLESADAIAELLPRFLDAVRRGNAPLATWEHVRESSRAGRAARLAQQLAAVTA